MTVYSCVETGNKRIIQSSKEKQKTHQGESKQMQQMLGRCFLAVRIQDNLSGKC